MNVKDGSSSNLESSSEDKKDKKENVENEDENPGVEVVTKADVTDCDIKSLKGLKYSYQHSRANKYISNIL